MEDESKVFEPSQEQGGTPSVLTGDIEDEFAFEAQAEEKLPPEAEKTE